MQAMAMSPHEQVEFQKLKRDVMELHENWKELNSKMDKIFSLVKGIAIGLAIGAVIFGLLSIKDVINFLK